MQENEKQFNRNDVDWYEVDDAGETVMSLKDRLMPKVKPVLIGLAVVVVVAPIALFVYSVVRFFYNTSESEQIAQDTNLYIEACQNEQDVQKCVDSASMRLAQETGNISYCEGLTGEKLDSCFVTSALTSHNIDDCKGISDATVSAQCNDAVLALTMPAEHSFEECAKYLDLQLQEQCEQVWVFDTILKGECDYPQISSDTCASGAIVSDAMAKQDPDICLRLSDVVMMEYCMERTLPGDRDFDGLDASEEEYYGTSDTSTDTDSDGYTDSEEILSGHDPLR